MDVHEESQQHMIQHQKVRSYEDGKLLLNGSHGIAEFWTMGMLFSGFMLLVILLVFFTEGIHLPQLTLLSGVTFGVCWLGNKLTDNYYYVDFRNYRIMYNRQLLFRQQKMISPFSQVYTISVSGVIHSRRNGWNEKHWSYEVVIVRMDRTVVSLGGVESLDEGNSFARDLAKALQVKFTAGRKMHELIVTDSKIPNVPRLGFARRMLSKDILLELGLILGCGLLSILYLGLSSL